MQKSDAEVDADFIAQIQASPNDDVPRLIYADWLEEQGDPRGEYLRLECEIASLHKDDALFHELSPRMQQLRKALDVRWLVAIGRTRINNCSAWTFRCPKRWESLKITGDPRIRHCHVCDQLVYFCESLSEVRLRSRQGNCIAVDSFTKITPEDLVTPRQPPPEDILMGVLVSFDEDDT